MVGRKNVHTLHGKINEGDNVSKVGHKVALGEHNALSLTGGTGGEHKLRKSIGIDLCVVICRRVRRKFHGTCLTPSKQAVLTVAVKVKRCGKSERLGDELTLFGNVKVAHKKIALAAFHGVEQVLLCPVSVKGNPDAARSHRGIVGLDERISMLTDNRDLLALVASCDYLCRKRSYVVAHLVIGYLACLLVVGVVAIAVCNLALVAFANILDHLADIRVLSLFT